MALADTYNVVVNLNIHDTLFAHVPHSTIKIPPIGIIRGVFWVLLQEFFEIL